MKKPKAWTQCPASSKKNLDKKNYRNDLLGCFQKTKSTETSGSVSAKNIEQVKNTKYELKVLHFVDCFPDVYGKNSGTLVLFVNTSF